MSKEALYTQTVTLPTQGLLNPEVPDGLVTQRIMMVADKKFLAGTNADGEKIVAQLIERCTTVPQGFDTSKLINQDLLFLLFKLRILSYGDDFSFKTKCPECGKRTTVKIKLSELTVHTLEEGYEGKLQVVLPHRGDKVFTKFLTVGEGDDIAKEVKRLRKKFADSESDPSVSLRVARMIERIELVEANKAGDTELTDPVDILKYVEELTDLDSIAIQSTVENIKVGVDPEVETKCSECGEYIDVYVSFSAEFFRPKYEG